MIAFLFCLCFLLLSTEVGVEAGGCICVNTIRTWSLGVPGGSACSTYMYSCFDFHLVGLYANMAEMPGVRQIDG